VKKKRSRINTVPTTTLNGLLFFFFFSIVVAVTEFFTTNVTSLTLSRCNSFFFFFFSLYLLQLPRGLFRSIHTPKGTSRKLRNGGIGIC